MVDESIPVGEFGDTAIGDWRGYDLVVARWIFLFASSSAFGRSLNCRLPILKA